MSTTQLALWEKSVNFLANRLLVVDIVVFGEEKNKFEVCNFPFSFTFAYSLNLTLTFCSIASVNCV